MSPADTLADNSPSRGSPEWWDARYLSGDVPWDTGIVPPEVVSLLDSGIVRLNGKPAWALDIGCGSGLSSRYLAAHGFRVVGVDLAQVALSRSHRAAQAAGLPAYFCRASVTDLSFLAVRAALAIDVGCFHALPPEDQAPFIASLAARLLPGAPYLLYAFEPRGEATDGPEGIGPVEIALFAPYFTLLRAQHGNYRERASAWYLMLRRGRPA
jgi:SAM-dependent methyltransferase